MNLNYLNTKYSTYIKGKYRSDIFIIIKKVLIFLGLTNVRTELLGDFNIFYVYMQIVHCRV